MSNISLCQKRNSKTRFISKYLPIAESDISPSKQIKYSAIMFQQVAFFLLLFWFLITGKNISVNTKCDLLSK